MKKIKQRHMIKIVWEEVDKANHSENRIFEKSLKNKKPSAKGKSGESSPTVSAGEVRLCSEKEWH